MKSAKVGQVVRMKSYDAYGFIGRELHPVSEDVGFEGRVLAVVDEGADYQCVLVSNSVRDLHLMAHELELLRDYVPEYVPRRSAFEKAMEQFAVRAAREGRPLRY